MAEATKKTEPTVRPVAGACEPLEGVQAQTSGGKTDPPQEVFDSLPGQIAGLRKLFSEISRAADRAARQKILPEFCKQVSALKERSPLPESRPVWLIAFALEGLLKQLSGNKSEVTASVLGTVAGAVDLVEALSIRGLDPDLATEPVRLLAVDDDPVSRYAISFALNKVFNPPDLVPNAEAALGLIARQTYDVIFLDVDMPGMGGFELCAEIHRTEGHQTTPVVFVTRHSDFHSRAKSVLSGGEYLIAKPFLPFELTVKALTLALRGRLLGQRRTDPVYVRNRLAASCSGRGMFRVRPKVSPAKS